MLCQSVMIGRVMSALAHLLVHLCDATSVVSVRSFVFHLFVLC
jgi:hypothetical protein